MHLRGEWEVDIEDQAAPVLSPNVETGQQGSETPGRLMGQGVRTFIYVSPLRVPSGLPSSFRYSHHPSPVLERQQRKAGRETRAGRAGGGGCVCP